MRFKVERNFLVKTYEEIELDPKKFLHCSTIEELNDEIEDFISCSNSDHPTHPGFQCSEELGMRFWDSWFENDNDKSFYVEWQRLKGLPAEL